MGALARARSAGARSPGPAGLISNMHKCVIIIIVICIIIIVIIIIISSDVMFSSSKNNMRMQ